MAAAEAEASSPAGASRRSTAMSMPSRINTDLRRFVSDVIRESQNIEKQQIRQKSVHDLEEFKGCITWHEESPHQVFVSTTVTQISEVDAIKHSVNCVFRLRMRWMAAE